MDNLKKFCLCLRIAGLKGFLSQVIKRSRCIWEGSLSRKAEARSNTLKQPNNYIFYCNQKTHKERQKIKEYKHSFENTLWEDNKQKYLNGDLPENALKDSDIDEIDLAVINWFFERWFRGSSQPSSERIQFYLWLEAVYLYHLKKYSKNKNDYFQVARQQSHNKSILKIGKSTFHLAKGIFAFGSGILYLMLFDVLKNIFKDILFFVSNNIAPAISDKALENVSFLIVLLLGFCAMAYLWRILYKETYYKEMVPHDRKHETWVRHVKSIQGYQKVILEYLEDLGDFSDYINPNDKDKLLMSKILSVWENNALRFHENMQKGPKKI